MDQLATTIRRMLWTDWDPIGINQFSGTADEYDSYVPALVELVRKGASERALFDWLWTLETNHLGLEGDRRNTKQFAEKLHEIAMEFESGH